MSNAIDIGKASWSDDEIVESLDEFLEIYRLRPGGRNDGGMLAPQMFGVWFICRQLRPKTVIESGVWRGVGTWLIRQSVPDAEIIAIEPYQQFIRYRQPNTNYLNRDFAKCNWNEVDPETTLVFFDDHQNALTRIQQCIWFGFRHVLLEDNYPAGEGDCYSLKQVFAGSGFSPKVGRRRRLADPIRRLLRTDYTPLRNQVVEPNSVDAAILRRHLELYYEFPPIVRLERTRFGTAWEDRTYPTKPALMSQEEARRCDPVLIDEADGYSWLSLVRLRNALSASDAVAGSHSK